LLVLVAANLSAQDDINADSLYVVAKQYSIDGKYDEAIRLSEQILETYPEYYDVRVLLARTYAWQNNFDEAVTNISQVLAQDAKNYDALNALTDFYFWGGDNRASLTTVDRALVYYPDDETLLAKKAKILLAEGNEKEARLVVRQLEEIDPANDELSVLKKSAEISHPNAIRLEHYFDTFSEPYRRNWHMSSIGYGRRTSYGDYYAKVYWGDLVGDGEKLYSQGVGKQVALEMYPKINEFNSLFVNYSWSPDNVFPQHRAGLEYYHVFQNRVEVSGGYRFLSFAEGLPKRVNVNIATGSLAKYINKFWVSFRPYIVFNETETSYIFFVTGRYYLPKEESYLGLTLGTGVSPDNPYFYTNEEKIPDLQSWRIEAEWKQKIGNAFLLELQGGYENAEYKANERRDQFTFRTSISWLF